MIRLRSFFITILLCLLIPSVYAKNTLVYKFEGINGDILKNVQARLLIDQAEYGENLSVNNIQTIYKRAPEQIRQAIKPYGYIKPIIHSSLIHHDSVWEAKYQIKLGSPLIIYQTDIKLTGPGSEDKRLQIEIENFPLKKGDVFNTEIYNKAKEKLFEVATNRGYVQAALENNKIMIDVATNQVTIMMDFQTGPKYYFGSVTFLQNAYNSKFLHRFIPFTENEVYSSQRLIKLQQEMEASPYFKQVNVTPNFTQVKNHRVPLQIEVLAPKSQKYNIGIGYGTFTHTRLSAGVSLRHLTTTGHHFDAQLRLSSVISSLAAKYYIPGGNPLTDQWVIGSDIKLFTPKNVFSKSTTIFGGYETKIQNIKSSLYFNYLIERYRIDANPTLTSEIFYPRLNLYYVNADDLINPNFGKSLNFTLQGGVQDLLSKTSFMQSELKGKFIYSPLNYSRIILKADLGYTTVHDIKNLPASLRFYAGESNGLRGYPDSSAGPGRYLIIGSAEYQHRIIENWYAAIFYDVGKSVDHINDPFKRSAGIGVIYQSIIGPVKLYGAHAINSKTKKNSFEFSIGPEF